MSTSSPLYNALVLASALLALGLAFYATTRDRRLASRAFALLMLALAEWSLCYVFADLVADPAIRLFWLAGAYVGIAFAGPLWLLFALANTGRIELLPRRVVVGIVLLGALGLAAVLANVALALWSSGVAVAVETPHGPLFWLHTLIAYSTIFAGLAACARTFVAAGSPYREQAGLMLLGALLPLLVNMVFLSSPPSTPAPADMTPVALAATSLAFAYAVRRHRLLTISPIARQVVLDSMSDGLVVVDHAGRLVEHNPAAVALAAIQPAAIGRPLGDAVGNRALAAVLDAMLAGETDTSRECTIADAEQRERRIQVTRSPLADSAGRKLGALLMLRDITAQVRDQEALARQAADLTTLHHVASAVGSTLDPHALMQTIVVTTRDALGMSHASLGLIDRDRGELTIIAESAAAPEASAVGISIRTRGWPFEEHWRSGRPTAIEDPQSDERLAALRDLLRRRNARSLLIVPLRANDQLIGTLNLASAAPRQFDREELALAQMVAGYVATAIANAQLFDASQRAVRTKSAILDTVSHEFRTPITAILGFTELYQERVLGPVAEEQQEALDAIHRNGRRLLKLVDDLLDTARLEAGHLDMALYPVAVDQCIKDAAAMLRPELQQKQLELRLEIAGGLPFAWADAMWLRRVLINLLSNAIRFTSAGQITVRAFEALRPGEPAAGAPRLIIEVEDTGLGIAEVEQQTIFEAFRRAEDTRTAIPAGSGSGLGLAISKRAIDQMEGQISVRSEPGRGSTFTIALRSTELALEHPSL